MSERDRKDMLQEALELSFDQFMNAEPGSKEQFNIAENTNKLYRLAVDEYKVETTAWHEEEKIQNDLDIQKRRILADIERYRKVSADSIFKVLGSGFFTGVALVYTAKGHIIPQSALKFLSLPKYLG